MKVSRCLGGKTRVPGSQGWPQRPLSDSAEVMAGHGSASVSVGRSGPCPTVHLWLILCVLLAGAGWAQPAQGLGSKYYVWGQVRSPGAYSFVASPDIVELLSAGGGPTENANLKRVVLIRAVTQKRTRIDLQKVMDSGQVMRLAPGDVVIVPTSGWSNVRDWLTVLTSAASLITLVLTIMARANL